MPWRQTGMNGAGRSYPVAPMDDTGWPDELSDLNPAQMDDVRATLQILIANALATSLVEVPLPGRSRIVE
ncbi:MAG: hypothetical protein ACREHE_14205 [Rhizomicrobium sp.]